MMTRNRRFACASVAALVAVAAACSSSEPSGGGPSGNPNPPGGSTSNAITVQDNSFNPSATTVPAGTTVTWTWAAGSANHNVTFTTGLSSATQSSGTFARTFPAAGSFGYLCTIHGSAMSGTITVQ